MNGLAPQFKPNTIFNKLTVTANGVNKLTILAKYLKTSNIYF